MGDYNLIFKQEESKNRRFSSQEKNVSHAVKQMFADANMLDIWENSSKFTWRRANSDVFSTIDRIFYSKDSFETVRVNTNWSLSFSDHAAVELGLNLKNRTSSEGNRSKITRLDPSVVADLTLRTLIIEEVNRLLNMAQPDWNPHLKLDYAKMCIRTVVEKIQADRKVREKTEEDYLNVELDIAIKSLEARTLPSRERLELIDLIESLRNRKQELIEVKGKRLAEKLGSKWYNEGEKSTKYFLRIMNRVNPDKFGLLEADSGEVLVDEKAISEEIVTYYKALYENYDKEKLDVNTDDSFFDEIAGLTPDEERAVSEPITLEELAKTLATCRDSAPGPDGIPYSIIKALWQPFGAILVEAWNYSLRTGKLPQSHKVSFFKTNP